MYGCALDMRAKKKKKKKNYSPAGLKYILLFSPCLSLSVALNTFSQAHSLCLTFSQAHSLKLSHLCFTAVGPRSSTSPPLKLDVTDPPADPLSRTPTPPIHLRPMPLITSLLPIHFRLVIDLYLLHLHAWDF